MEVYINSEWTKCHGNSCYAEAILCSGNGNHASMYTTGSTAEEADAKLIGALRELKLVAQKATKD